MKRIAPVLRGRAFLQTPGPSNIPDRVLSAMHRPAIDFSSPEFTDLALSVLADLKTIFCTRGRVFIYAANGHGAWEAAIANVVNPGEHILVPDTGTFSMAWANMARKLGVETRYLDSDWRTGVDPERIESALKADLAAPGEPRTKAVAMVHTDTATGITSDVGRVREAIDHAGHPALLLVDVIASLGTTRFEMDELGVDVAVGAAQKGLMLPPGLGFTAVSDKAEVHASKVSRPRSYWDWESRAGEESYMWFCGTAPEHMIFGLREAIDMLLEEGLENAFARHARIAEATRRCVGHWSRSDAMAFNALRAEERSNSITCIRVAEMHDAEALRRHCREHLNVALGGGFGELSGTIFRIGHMGDINEPMILGTLATTEVGLSRTGIEVDPGGLQAAIDYLANESESPSNTDSH